MAHGPARVATIVWQVIALIVLHDAWFYWMHRALHTRALFRLTHLAHHRSRTPTSWAAYSFATGEAVCEALVIPAMFLIVAAIAPVEPLAVFIFLGHQIARNAIGHSGHELAWSGFTRSPLTAWLTTTTHHDLHHSEGRYNYGLYFTWWDRWMGTEHPRYHDRFEAVATRTRKKAGAATREFISQGIAPRSCPPKSYPIVGMTNEFPPSTEPSGQRWVIVLTLVQNFTPSMPCWLVSPNAERFHPPKL
jgi:sterol desaturase/sphingolipid hydroxylase (fatty acid hydroxylase superfamily)